MTRPGKIPSQAGFELRTFRFRGGRLNHLANEAVGGEEGVVGCSTSQQHASVSQGEICSDDCTCCHTEIEVADQTCCLTLPQYYHRSNSLYSTAFVLTRARMHDKVVGNFGSEADVGSLYFRGFRFKETSDNGACTYGQPAK